MINRIIRTGLSVVISSLVADKHLVAMPIDSYGLILSASNHFVRDVMHSDVAPCVREHLQVVSIIACLLRFAPIVWMLVVYIVATHESLFPILTKVQGHKLMNRKLAPSA